MHKGFLPCYFLLSLSRDCNPAPIAQSLYACYHISRNPTSHSPYVIVLLVIGPFEPSPSPYAHQCPTHNLVSFLSMSKLWAIHWTASRRVFKGSVTDVGKEVFIRARRAWVCIPSLPFTGGHSRGSHSLTYALASSLGIQSLMSASQRGYQQHMKMHDSVWHIASSQQISPDYTEILWNICPIVFIEIT